MISLRFPARPLWLPAWQVLLIFALAGGPVSAHDFHASVGNVELNREAGTLEVILRVFSNDLERAVARDAGLTAFRLGGAEEEPIARYVRKHFWVLTQDQQPLPQTWIGLEWTVKETWLYVEIKLPEESTELNLSNTLFLDWFASQINTVNLKGVDRHTLVFNQDRRQLPIPKSWLTP